METFTETFANKSSAISKLNFSESTFVYAVFNKEQNKTKQKIQLHEKFKKVTVTDQRKPKLYIMYKMLPK